MGDVNPREIGLYHAHAERVIALWELEAVRADAWMAHPNRPWNRGQMMLEGL